MRGGGMGDGGGALPGVLPNHHLLRHHLYLRFRQSFLILQYHQHRRRRIRQAYLLRHAPPSGHHQSNHNADTRMS